MATTITDLQELLSLADADEIVIRDASEIAQEPVKKTTVETLKAAMLAHVLQELAAAGASIKGQTLGPFTVSSAGSHTPSHDLGAKPRFISPVLRCITDEAGFVAGDDVPIDFNSSYGSIVSTGVSIVPDESQLSIRFGGHPNTISVLNHTTGSLANITPANWRLYVHIAA